MANEYSADIPKGLNVPKQIRLDSITSIQNEATLKNLGPGNNLAFKYYDGLKIYCKDEKIEYVWREVVGVENGLLDNHFIYPTYPSIDGINYSGKSYNFFQKSETKLVSGINTTVVGLGTLESPYVINSVDTIANGSETKINAGTNITISGNGTISTPYIINSASLLINDATSSIKGVLRLTGDLGGTADAPTTPTAVHLTGAETISDSKSFTSIIEITGVNSGIAFNTSTGWTTNYAFPMLTRTGSLFTLRGSASGGSNRYGSIFDNTLLTTVDRTFTFPDKNGIFALTSDLNLQREITTSTVISNTDNNYIIFINNDSTPITITINSSITTSNFCVGFIQEGTGDVTFVGSGVSLINPIGLKSKGQGYQTFIERKLATSNFYLLGNTKV